MIRNMLGLLGNVAEVTWLRPNLMNSFFVQEITKLLDYDGIEVINTKCFLPQDWHPQERKHLKFILIFVVVVVSIR